jgi:class 3 adenylate cyclase/TolB-like protein
MAPETAHVERRLAAIVAADVAGYSRLVAADEEGTIARLQALLHELVEPSVARHHGRIVKTTGDGLLLEFGSVVDAVRCAIEVQQDVAVLNAPEPPERRITFRIGIHIGDIVIQDDDLLGDGVNVAARLEGIAPPGGIAISEAAQQQVEGKIDIALIDQGAHRLKNIAHPIRVFRVDFDGAGAAAQARWRSRTRYAVAAIALCLVGVIVAGSIAWHLHGRPAPAPLAAVSAPLPALPPPAPGFSIVVLPFANLSGDATQDYLAEIITEELTSYLSRLPDTFVIAHDTAASYRGQAVDVKQIGKELGVHYVLEGSAEPSGQRLRVAVQLIDAVTGANIWADQFDAERADLLQMQDDIVTRLARRMQIELTSIEAARLAAVPAKNADAEDLAMRCEAIFLRSGMGRPEAEPGFAFCEQALQADPRNVRALSILGLKFATEAANRSTDRQADIAQADDLIKRALAVDPRYYLAHHAKAWLMLAERNPEAAVEEEERSLAVNPSYIGSYVALCSAQIAMGQPELALKTADTAIRLSPRDPVLPAIDVQKAEAYLMLRQDQPAVEWLRRSIAESPESPTALPWLIAALALGGHDGEAHALLQRYLALGLTRIKTVAQFKALDESDTARYLALRGRLYDGLRKAGMPEQ